MLAKLLLVMAVAGWTSLALLATRQQRIEAAHEMSRLHADMIRDDALLWSLRRTIHAECRPDRASSSSPPRGRRNARWPAEPP